MVDVHRRSLPEESTKRTTGDQTLLEGEADGMTRTERRQREKEREETGELQGTRNPGESGRGGEDTDRDRRQEANRKAGASGMRTSVTITKTLFR